MLGGFYHSVFPKNKKQMYFAFPSGIHFITQLNVMGAFFVIARVIFDKKAAKSVDGTQ